MPTVFVTLSCPIASADCEMRRPVTVMLLSSPGAASCACAALNAPAAHASSSATREERRIDEVTDMQNSLFHETTEKETDQRLACFPFVSAFSCETRVQSFSTTDQ
jgi:hypothetical protein